ARARCGCTRNSAYRFHDHGRGRGHDRGRGGFAAPSGSDPSEPYSTDANASIDAPRAVHVGVTHAAVLAGVAACAATQHGAQRLTPAQCHLLPSLPLPPSTADAPMRCSPPPRTPGDVDASLLTGFPSGKTC